MTNLESWIRSKGITEVECLVPDMSGIARGKILPADQFLRNYAQQGLRLPESVFVQTVTGEYPDDYRIEGWDNMIDPRGADIYMYPDPATIRMVPWYDEPTAQVLCDCFYADGQPVSISPRTVLRRVLDLYKDKGWKPVVAPELEFYLVQKNEDADLPLKAPIGRSGRQETGRQSFGIDAVNEFDPIFEDVYDYCEEARIDVDTLIHESGPAQMEVNFRHGDAIELADQVFLFKRLVRQASIQHGVYATFMAKPIQDEPGSAMHVHLSIEDFNGTNLFGREQGGDTDLFHSFIAGHQRHLQQAMLFLAPNVNSYRRLVPDWDAPTNLNWAHDNRTVGFRVPVADYKNRRMENRVAGADANPYLLFAATLACGYLGMVEGLKPTEAFKGDAYKLPNTLPTDLSDAVQALEQSQAMRDVLGARFVGIYLGVKKAEAGAYRRVISSWEREHLLLNV